MVKTKPKTIDEILSKADESQRATTERLRSIVKATLPKAQEMVRRGQITYTLDGKDCSGIRLTKQHVDLLFPRGASLSSPILKGQGTVGDPKHIQVNTLKNFDAAEARRLLLEEASTVETTR